MNILKEYIKNTFISIKYFISLIRVQPFLRLKNWRSNPRNPVIVF